MLVSGRVYHTLSVLEPKSFADCLDLLWHHVAIMSPPLEDLRRTWEVEWYLNTTSIYSNQTQIAAYTPGIEHQYIPKRML